MGAPRRRYEKAYQPFRAWCSANGFRLTAPEDMDIAACEWMESLFFKGHGIEAAEILLAAVLWRLPWLRRKGGLALGAHWSGGSGSIRPRAVALSLVSR